MRFLYIGIGAVLGAWSRYGVSLLLQRFIIADFPWATFVVNVLGSFGIGFLLPYLAKNATVNIKLFAITGYLGAFTTFSTFSIEALQLFQKEKSDVAFYYIGFSVLCALVAVYLGSNLANR